MGAILKERDYVGIVLGVISFLAAGWLCWWALTTRESWKAIFARRRGSEGRAADERGVEMRDLKRGEKGGEEREGVEGGRGDASVEDGDGDGVWTTIRM